MRVKEAKNVARQWVIEHAGSFEGFHAAFHAGSTHWLPDEAELADASDIDVMISLTGSLPPVKPGKIPYHGALLDVSPLPASMLREPDSVLSDYHLAGAFRTRGVILDPSGDLERLYRAVSREFARSRWVYARCAAARDNLLRYLAPPQPDAPFHAQVMSWVFAAGVTTHVLLAAGTRNPTVRTRYVAARALLADYGRLDFYPSLLALLGSQDLTPRQVDAHLDTLAETFDASSAVMASPFPFASDISATARHIAIDGSRDLVARGLHREAVFWIVVTHARCMTVLDRDGDGAARERAEQGFDSLLADLGICSEGDLTSRREEVRAFLPHLSEMAEAVIEANPAVEP